MRYLQTIISSVGAVESLTIWAVKWRLPGSHRTIHGHHSSINKFRIHLRKNFDVFVGPVAIAATSSQKPALCIKINGCLVSGCRARSRTYCNLSRIFWLDTDENLFMRSGFKCHVTQQTGRLSAN